MTTPGRQAGPTADDGGLDPATGDHPGNGIPGGDAGSGLPPHRTRPDAGTRDAEDHGLPSDGTRQLPETRGAHGYGPPLDRTRPGASAHHAGQGLPTDQT